MAEGAALEMRYTRKGIVSSNLTPSALHESSLLDPASANPYTDVIT